MPNEAVETGVSHSLDSAGRGGVMRSGQIRLGAQCDHEAAAAVIHGGAPGSAAVTAGDLPNQGQTQSIACAVVATVTAVEGREQLFELGRRRPEAAVPNLQDCGVTCLL